MGGMLALPGLVCCHNPIIWAPGAEAESEQDGAAYRSLVQETARLTATIGDDALLDTAFRRLAELRKTGVTACEIKTGFGLAIEDELRHALLARRLQKQTDLLTRVTLYPGHFIPDDADADDRIEEIVTRLLPKVYEAQACECVEVFCDDDGGLDLDRASTILEAFYRKKTPSRVSCDRFSDSAGATLPASFYSQSAAYLCCSDADGIGSVAATGTSTILIPEIAKRDRDSARPDIQAMRDVGARLAVSTQGGPDGTGIDLLGAARLAVNCFQLTPVEALMGITIHAASALGVDQVAGSLACGRRGDLALFDAATPLDLVRIPEMRPRAVVTAGAIEELS
uniref:imidazolonepropionase n=1 Tax=Aminobacter ciceronei TaxID=150723 RepID=Q93S68_9HYPH|nr:imidazolonepropionase HutI [Aminobacter ciceronei]